MLEKKLQEAIDKMYDADRKCQVVIAIEGQLIVVDDCDISLDVIEEDRMLIHLNTSC